MLAELITERMEALGLSQAELARKSALSRQYISDLRHGRRGARISVTTQTKLSRALRVSQTRIAESVAFAEPDSTTVTKAPDDLHAPLE